MTIIERRIKGKFVSIGTIENVGRCEWFITVFDKNSINEYEPFLEGCSTSRRDAVREIREVWRNQKQTSE